MYTIETGFFPLAGLMVGATLYALYFWLLRLKAEARWTQAFVALCLLLTTALSFVTPSKVVEYEALNVTETDFDDQEQTEKTENKHLNIYQAESDKRTQQEVRGTETTERNDSYRKDYGEKDLPYYLWRVYLVGVAVAFIYFLCQLVQLYRYGRQQRLGHESDSRIYMTDGGEPFSFGRSIFVPKSLTEEVRRYVLLHEQAHIHHRHFLKLCLCWAFVAAGWYNPFVWLFYGEMRLQQELEVDGDVLRSGIDRKNYQRALLSVCVQQGKWLLLRSAFNLEPLKKRIVYMNTLVNPKDRRLRQWASACAFAWVLATAIVLGCQAHETLIPVGRPHPLEGCWTMDWISNTGSGEEVYPMAKHYGFYNHDTFLCFNFRKKQGKNIQFYMSGEEVKMKADTLVNARGEAMDYDLKNNGQTYVLRWRKDATQFAGVGGMNITEQWTRTEADRDVVAVLGAVLSADENKSQPLNGVWKPEGKTDHDYLILNDSIFMLVVWNHSEEVQNFKYGGRGLCGLVTRRSDGTLDLFGWSSVKPLLSDHSHLILSSKDGAGQKEETAYRRITLPAELRRAFSPALKSL